MTQTNVLASAQVDGDKLAEAMRRVAPFMAMDEVRPGLTSLFIEADEGTVEITACDGYRIAHVTLREMGFPDGEYILQGSGCKDFAQRHYGGQQVAIEVYEKTVKLGDVSIQRVEATYPDYRRVIPATVEVIHIIETKLWIKAIRKYGAERVGVVYSPEGCRMYFEAKDGEPLGFENVPTQMFSGPKRKVAYRGEQLRRALTSCGKSATIKLSEDATQPTLFEAENYWHLLAPLANYFPKEVSFSTNERQLLSWAEETIQAVRKGEVPAKVIVGGGRLYVELNESRSETEILLETPELKEREA